MEGASATRRAVEEALGRARRGRRRRDAPTSCPRRSPPPRPARRPASGPSTLREAFGDYRGPTGVTGAPQGDDSRAARRGARPTSRRSRTRLGHPIRILVAKPGLDGHSNGAEQIAVRARDVGMEVVYQGIRLTPEEIAASAIQEDVDVVGLSILSGSHLELVPRVVELIRAEGADIPVIVGGIIPPAHARKLDGRRHRARLHAQGLRDQPDHGRDRRPRRRARRAAAAQAPQPA